jgi:hypothetical protein
LLFLLLLVFFLVYWFFSELTFSRVPVRCFFLARVRWPLNPHQTDATERLWFLSVVGFKDS